MNNINIVTPVPNISLSTVIQSQPVIKTTKLGRANILDSESSFLLKHETPEECGCSWYATENWNYAIHGENRELILRATKGSSNNKVFEIVAYNYSKYDPVFVTEVNLWPESPYEIVRIYMPPQLHIGVVTCLPGGDPNFNYSIRNDMEDTVFQVKYTKNNQEESVYKIWKEDQCLANVTRKHLLFKVYTNDDLSSASKTILIGFALYLDIKVRKKGFDKLRHINFISNNKY